MVVKLYTATVNLVLPAGENLSEPGLAGTLRPGYLIT